jgi:hypothetical protein
LPRLLSRALFVVGAVIAGTAVAWLLSTATASADTVPVPPIGNVLGTVTSIDVPAVPAVPSVPAIPAVPKVAGDLGKAVARLSERLPGRAVDVPAPPDVAPAPETPPAHAGRSATHARKPAPVHVSHGTMPTPTAVVPDRSPATVTPVSAPARPPVPARPMPRPVPGSLPAAPLGSGGVGSSGTGGSTPADTTGTSRVSAPGVLRVVPPTAPIGVVTPGRQPGITPD